MTDIGSAKLRREGPGKWIRSCTLSYHGVHHGVAKFLPFVETAEQRTHTANTVFSQLQRRTGAGGLVRSSAEQYDLAVARDFAVTSFEIFGRNLQRSRQSAWIAQDVERMAEVNDHDRFAGLQLVLQLVRCNAVTFDLSQKALPFTPAVENVRNDTGGKQEQQIAAEALRVKVGAIELLAEDKPEPRERARPQQSP